MRSVFFALLCMFVSLPAWNAALAEPGTEAERVSRASALDEGLGAIVISIRSELYLDDPLSVYFLREGGSIDNPQDVIRFERKQGFLAFGNDTVKFKVRSYELRPGTYRLIAHGMDCPKIPAEDERCLIEVQGLGGAQELSRPSRGYGEEAPSFEIRAGTVTYAGDFVLMSRNTIEWAEIPGEELKSIRRRFEGMPVGPAPEVPEDFRLRFGVFPREFSDDAGRRY